MATAESIEGTVGTLWFHFDLTGDVLYLRLISARDVDTHGEEDDNGNIVLRSLSDDRVVGLTVVNWWKRFGSGSIPDSMREIVARVEPWAEHAHIAA